MARARTPRPRALLAVAWALALLAAAAACDRGGGAGDEPASAGGGGDRLAVVRDDGAGGAPRRSEHACADAPGLCATVRALRDEPRPDACTEVYGGPQRIVVDGTLDGRPARLVVTRRDGCEIARYDRLAAALEDAGG